MRLIERLEQRLWDRVKPALAKHRRSSVAKFTASVGQGILDGFHNADYDPATNGEEYVLQALSGSDMSIFLDVGANHGIWTAAAKRWFPKAEVHAFEVHPDTYRTLEKNVKELPGVKLVNCGLSDAQGEIELHCFGSASGLTSMIDYPHADQLDRSTVSARVIRGDQYLQEHGITHVDFLKIDVEGVEDRVLRGLQSFLAAGAVDIVQFEYGRVNILTGYLLRNFYQDLGAAGYVIGKIFPTHVEFRDYRLEDEDFRGPNYLAVRKEKASYIETLSR
jgi:FkbM family methyltransferase